VEGEGSGVFREMICRHEVLELQTLFGDGILDLWC
jgi:hypothetical protein